MAAGPLGKSLGIRGDPGRPGAHPVLIRAYRGEFGLKVRYHVPWVYAQGRGHTIEIEEGEEALYPLARRWNILPRAHDNDRRGGPGKRSPVRWFVPAPHVVQNIGTYDVVVCPRRRLYGDAKNWDAWLQVTHSLQEMSVPVFAAGAPDSSYNVQCPRAWDYTRFLDASIEAMLSARLVVATDAGLAHLAVLCGRPVLLVTFRGLVAPGPVRDTSGHVFRRQYWPVRWREYYEAANHQNAPLEMIDGWEHPERVVRRVAQIIIGELDGC